MQQKQAAKAFLVYKHLKKIEALEAYYLNISQQLFQQTLVVLTQYHQPIDNVHNVTSNTQCVNEISSNHQAQIAETNVCFGLNINNNSRNHNTNNPNSSTINAIKHNVFKCTHCNFSTKWKQNLSRHAKIHSDEKDFQCAICGKEFKQKSNLKVHSRTHSGEKPFACKICKKQFTTSSNLKTHKRRKHLQNCCVI
eukprot:383626_1